MNGERRRMKWWGWGAPQISVTPPSAFVERLAERIGTVIVARPVERRRPDLPDPRAVTVPCEVATSDDERLAHAVGRSFVDLVRLRGRRLEHAPDAVAFPSSADEVQALVGQKGFAVVPFGGGTSVVGGVSALRGSFDGVISVDMSRLSRVLDFDPVSLTVRVEAGVFGPDLESFLNSKGATLGHFPQSFEYSTLGGWIATRSAGQESTRYGGIDRAVVAITAVTPTGLVSTARVPGSATGPEIRELLVGSEGCFGVITDATLRLTRLPEARAFRSYLFPAFDAGVSACREILQAGWRPAVVRLSDETETDLAYDLSGTSTIARSILKRLGRAPGAHLLLSSVGNAASVRAETSAMGRIARRNSGLPLGASPGRKWSQERFRHPYLRDGLLDVGLFVDTFETATSWSKLLPLYHAVKAALGGVVAVHLSHAYIDGGSLYFTAFDAVERAQELEYWAKWKDVATKAVLSHGGTLSHHHGIGTDHRAWLPEERGRLAMAMIQQVKHELDPDGIMNPGKLL